MSRALLLVPPLLKYTAGPLLGPALLAGAGRSAGHHVSVLDLNIRWLRTSAWAEPSAEDRGPPGPSWTGDHDKPRAWLRGRERRWSAGIADSLPTAEQSLLDEDPVLSLTYGFEEVRRAAEALAAGPRGAWMDRCLADRSPPDLVGVSVLYSGQVVAALAVSLLARRRWPTAPVLWGGPHVSALAAQIETDESYGDGIDGFVAGYAEGTFVRCLDALEGGRALPPEVLRAGGGPSAPTFGGRDVVPWWEDLERYGTPRLTLPAQASRGCVYGRCAFCTYPAIEGAVQALAATPIQRTFELAGARGAAVSCKDSLVHRTTFETILGAACSGVPWSACTKLHPRWDGAFFDRLAASGCDTLEFGLETLVEDAQRMLSKEQSRALLTTTLDEACRVGVGVVINYITGFPGTDPADEARWLGWLRDEVDARPRVRIEHNRFQLERLSPMGLRPDAYGVRVLNSWPWASVLAWTERAVPLSRGA